MAEGLLFSIAEGILGKLGSRALQELGLLWGVKDELEKLQDTVSTIKAVLLDAEEKRAAGNNAVKLWLERLDDVVYKADDLLDDFSTEGLLREMMTQGRNKTKQVQKIVEEMLELATKKKPETTVRETLVADLKKEIDGKKYFLVLDDLWNEDSEKWMSLKTLLVGGARGSRILVTTRSEKVAKIAQAAKQYSLRGLDEDASWCLFKQMAFEKGEEPENSRIVAIGKEILEKCAGVPLAIRIIGRLLNLRNSEKSGCLSRPMNF
ncbi:putative disease resistance protein RGA1 [Morella rubra]|uniref:Putative disease resistance protein RGA1 n=1 Tax=Morella rubra TaxID=262757 RepID=A0A6A1W4D8_9ROSI|nr:putative disease resistance protein RGA1 [Morella rubra]